MSSTKGALGSDLSLAVVGASSVATEGAVKVATVPNHEGIGRVILARDREGALRTKIHRANVAGALFRNISRSIDNLRVAGAISGPAVVNLRRIALFIQAIDRKVDIARNVGGIGNRGTQVTLETVADKAAGVRIAVEARDVTSGSRHVTVSFSISDTDKGQSINRFETVLLGQNQGKGK